jgi:glycine/sarcosine N-methyltransferase
MAEHYHLIFQDWEVSMRRQGGIIASLLPPPTSVGPVLDCACGIGTQCLALAERGFQVDASDLSPSEAARAQQEAAARGLPIRVWVDDMRTLEKTPTGHYGAVLCMDNALPHLDIPQRSGRTRAHHLSTSRNATGLYRRSNNWLSTSPGAQLESAS